MCQTGRCKCRGSFAVLSDQCVVVARRQEYNVVEGQLDSHAGSPTLVCPSSHAMDRDTYLTLPTAGAAVAKPLFKAKFALAALRADLVEVANNLATILCK